MQRGAGFRKVPTWSVFGSWYPAVQLISFPTLAVLSPAALSQCCLFHQHLNQGVADSPVLSAGVLP